MENMTADQIGKIISALNCGLSAAKNLETKMPEWESKIQDAINVLIEAETEAVVKFYNPEL